MAMLFVSADLTTWGTCIPENSVTPMSKRYNPLITGREMTFSGFSRRRFIRYASLAAGAMATTKLTSCASSSTPEAEAETPTDSAATGDGKVLRILSWAGYDEPEIIGPFEKEMGVKVEFKTYVGGEQMLQFFNQSPQYINTIYPKFRWEKGRWKCYCNILYLSW